MSKKKKTTTPKPWDIDWYECRADRDDVKANPKRKVGDVLWRTATAIGPINIDHDHWAGYHLSAEEDDVLLAAGAPVLAAALEEVCRVLEQNATAIVDTVWVSSGALETLLEHCRAALAQCTPQPADAPVKAA